MKYLTLKSLSHNSKPNRTEPRAQFLPHFSSYNQCARSNQTSQFSNLSSLFLSSQPLMAFTLSTRYNVPLINLAFLFLLCFFLTTHPYFSLSLRSTAQDNCEDFLSLKDAKSRCAYLKSHTSCVPLGYIDYLQVFYCAFGERPVLGYFLSLLWLLILFYLLGNTASQYFCSSLENLSKVLKLSPAMAGVTLLSLGNGAPDLFSSIVSFTAGPGVEEVGLSSVLGGALFVTTVVVGIISLTIGSRTVSIDRNSFIRDVLLLILALCSILTILIYKNISIWGSLSFLSIYIGYVLLVCTSHFCGDDCHETRNELEDPLLVNSNSQIEENRVEIVIKEVVKGDKIEFLSNYLIPNLSNRSPFQLLLHVLELPLSLPRRLTIPDITEERWHKPSAVLSVLLAPIFLATIWNSQYDDTGSKKALSIYMIGTIIGLILCVIALKKTQKSNPPREATLPWLIGGFLMSVVWTYLVARELVALLVSLGYMFGISPSILGLTVLAWGNSLGDLISNVAMALKGGGGGLQIAVSGCYAGPLFNTVVGLGLSLTFAAWRVYPEWYEITEDFALFETLFFLILGLIWALLVLPRREMKLDKVLGFGLLGIYLCFLILRFFEVIGFFHLGKYAGLNF